MLSGVYRLDLPLSYSLFFWVLRLLCPLQVWQAWTANAKGGLAGLGWTEVPGEGV